MYLPSTKKKVFRGVCSDKLSLVDSLDRSHLVLSITKKFISLSGHSALSLFLCRPFFLIFLEIYMYYYIVSFLGVVWASAQWFPCNHLGSLWPIKLKPYTVLPYQMCLRQGLLFRFNCQRSRSLLPIIENWFPCNNLKGLLCRSHIRDFRGIIDMDE